MQLPCEESGILFKISLETREVSLEVGDAIDSALLILWAEGPQRVAELVGDHASWSQCH